MDETTTTALMVDPSNTEQAQACDGDEGAYWAANAQRFDRSVAAYLGPFMAAAAAVESWNLFVGADRLSADQPAES